MDAWDIQISSTEIHFPDEQLVATPTLELVGHCSRAELRILLADMNGWMLSAVLFPPETEVRSLVTHDGGTDVHVGVVDQVLLAALRSAFLEACALSIRTQPVTLLLNCKRDVGQPLACAFSARFTVGPNFFPDDPLMISICLRSSDTRAWRDLVKARYVISTMMGTHLLYSTLGYGFAFDSDQVMQVSQSMENLCMRYLGIDLNDPFGNYTSYMPRGFRSINWQIGIPERRLTSLTPAQSETMLGHTTLEDGVRYWRTGERPSICDRNSTSHHHAIAEYAAIDRQLQSLKYISPISWMPNWRSDTFERWQNRWAEIAL